MHKPDLSHGAAAPQVRCGSSLRCRRKAKNQNKERSTRVRCPVGRDCEMQAKNADYELLILSHDTRPLHRYADWPNAHGGDGPPRKISTGTLPATFTPPFCWAFSRCAQEFILSAETPPPHHPTATQKPRRHKARSTQREAGTLPTSRTCRAKLAPLRYVAPCSSLACRW
jgi:hypothetical protein